jgi:hypothetical protein
MPGKSDYLENAILNHVLRGTTFTPPSARYVGLLTSDPTDANTGVEVTGGGYVRQSIAFTAATTGNSSNSADILFPVASAAWGTVTHFGVFDASTGGNLLYFGTLTPTKSVASADQIKLAAGTLTITED